MRGLRFLLNIGVVVGISWFFYHSYQEILSTRNLVAVLKKEMNDARDVSLIGSRADTSASPEAKTSSWREVQSSLADCVVQVFSQIAEFNWLEPYKTPNQLQAAGSGFFISKDGLIITNAHVVDQAIAVSIQIPSQGKRRFDVDVIGVSPERDLALIKLQPKALEDLMRALGKIPTLPLGDSDSVRRADDVMALGYPLGQQSLKSTTGVVSGREHIARQHMIQISAAINHGSSGGPLINLQGEVIGVTRAGITSAQNVGYIIPSNEVKLFLRQLEQMPITDGVKLLRKPVLGVIFNSASDALTKFLGNSGTGGLYVVEALKGSPLFEAGVQTDDMIYEINGHRLDHFGEMSMPWSEDRLSVIDYISRLMIGDKIYLTVYRKGERKEMEFTFRQTDLMPIRAMEPGYENIDFEVIGGMVLMPLTLNHIPLLIASAPELARYTDLHKQMEPAVIITHILPNSAASRSRTLGAGMVLQEINGREVKTLSDVRKAIKEGISGEYLTIKTTEHVFAVFAIDDVLSRERILSKTYFYTLSPFVSDLLAIYETTKAKKTEA